MFKGKTWAGAQFSDEIYFAMLINFNKIGILLLIILFAGLGLFCFRNTIFHFVTTRFLSMTCSYCRTKQETKVPLAADVKISNNSDDKPEGQPGENNIQPGEKDGIREKTAQEAQDATIILLVGDIMLDRNVERLMEKHNSAYPFEKICQFLEAFDIVFGNLEGPIVESPSDFSDDSLKFAFKKEVAKTLAEANFNLLSLANNHTLNMGKKGLEETIEFLKEANIDFAGEPMGCSQDFPFKQDSIQLLAFNTTFPFNCQDEEIAATVRAVRAQDAEIFLIISLHWGLEYQLQSSPRQQSLAHKLIEAGADLIIGHHPHVAQEVELYQGQLIFYSLGNFIFDQYFSKETQQGLVVGLEVYPKKLVYRLFPVQSKLSQPFFMSGAEVEKFLGELAQKSSLELAERIKAGIIEIRR